MWLKIRLIIVIIKVDGHFLLNRQFPVAFSRLCPLAASLLRLAESPRMTLPVSSICYQKSHVLSGLFSIVPKQSKLNNADGRTLRLRFSLQGRARAPLPILSPSPRAAAEARGEAGDPVREQGRGQRTRFARCAPREPDTRPGGSTGPRRPPRRGLAGAGPLC